MKKYKEAKEVAIEFETELRALLLKYDAEMFVDNSVINYGNDYNIECTIKPKWKECMLVSEYTSINFGTYIG